MNEFIERLRANLDTWGELTEIVLNAISLVFIVYGVIATIITSIKIRGRFSSKHPLHTFFRMTFGGWLVVALEFQLAADLVGTIVSPTSGHLIELGAIALIRTFLNYFLGKELKKSVKYRVMKMKKRRKD